MYRFRIQITAKFRLQLSAFAHLNLRYISWYKYLYIFRAGRLVSKQWPCWMSREVSDCTIPFLLVPETHFSPIHTARWSRKIARKLPECLLCERKHVPGLIPGLIPGWDLVTLPGSVPERALCEQKPDQCRKGCVVVMTHFIVRLFYRVFWRQINVHTTKNM